MPCSAPGAAHGGQMAIARFLDGICLALQASGLWLRYASLQNLISSFPWIAPPRPPPWRNPRKGRDQIMPSGNHGPELLREPKRIGDDIDGGRARACVTPFSPPGRMKQTLCCPGGGSGTTHSLDYKGQRENLSRGVPMNFPRYVALIKVSLITHPAYLAPTNVTYVSHRMYAFGGPSQTGNNIVMHYPMMEFRTDRMGLAAIDLPTSHPPPTT